WIVRSDGRCGFLECLGVEGCTADARNSDCRDGFYDCPAQLPARREVLGGCYNEAECRRRSLKQFSSSISVDNIHNSSAAGFGKRTSTQKSSLSAFLLRS